MTNFLANSQTWLTTLVRGALATDDTLVYSRTGEQDIDMTNDGVCIGQHQDVLDSGEVVVLDVESIEYLIPRTLIDFGLGPVEPESGDRMTHTFPNGQISTFEATAYGGAPVWRWQDRDNRTTYRVQMQQVSLA